MSSDRLKRSMREYTQSGKRRKRTRTSSTRAVDEFLPGNIVEIEVHNFMTFTHLKSKPGARLNLVIGPNGSGKSSLVCAIAIGLAEEPWLFGRATSIGDYVKRGEESGWIRVTLKDQSSRKYIAITRKINKQNKSEWLYEENNVSHLVSTKDIQEVVSRFNIQVNNLTQFLPQDKVSEFAKMTPIQLLEETEKAVGDPELSRQHLSLIKKNADLKRTKMMITQRESVLASLKANNADLEKDVNPLLERTSLLEKAENLKKKVRWLKYEQKKALSKASNEQEMEAKQRLHEAAENLNTLKRPLEALREKKSEIETAVRSLLQQAHDQFEPRRQTLIENESKMGEQVREKTKQITEVHKRESVRQERLATASVDLASAAAQLANLPDYEPPTQEIQDIRNRIRELERGIAEKRKQKEEKEQLRFHKRQHRERLVRRIAEAGSRKSLLLQALKDSGARGIFDAYKWVESHRNEFLKDVYGPVLLEISISDREHAKYVENHVASYIWKAFVTQDDKDRDYLQRNLKFCDAVVINESEPSVRNAPPLTRQMKEMGIEARLDEVVSAPPVIKHVLNGHAQLDYSFIGTSQCANLAYALGVNDLWTPENHYRWTRSLSGSQVSASETAVGASRLLSQNVDARLKNELEEQKEECGREIAHAEQEFRNLHNDKLRLEEEADTLMKHRDEILKKMKLERKKRDELTTRTEQRKRRLDFLHIEARIEDCRTAEKRLRAEIIKLNHERKKNVLTLKDLVKESAKNQIQLIFEQLALAEIDVKVRDLERQIRSEEQLASEAQKKYNNSKREALRFRKLLRRAKKDSKRVTKFTKELQNMFREMPDTVEDLEGAISDALAEANAVPCNNPGVLEEYERRCKKIENLEVELDSEKSELRACLSEIESVKAKWLPTLRTLVAKINEAFGHNFRKMAVAGEVSLDEHGTDFGQYGILIKVKFRETEELQVLSAHHQSGGERSVSTILYLVSLQDLTHSPFRVVDEINQGMDPQNERKMFQQLVRAASQPNTPQCFLLTPKLLPNLEYNEACTILNIMNGPYMDAAAEMWKDGPSWTTLTQPLASH